MRVPFDVALERPRDPVTLAAVNLVDYMLEPRLGRKHMVKNGITQCMEGLVVENLPRHACYLSFICNKG